MTENNRDAARYAQIITEFGTQTKHEARTPFSDKFQVGEEGFVDHGKTAEVSIEELLAIYPEEKMCHGCMAHRLRSQFSSNQWSKPGRRCKVCVADSQTSPKPPIKQRFGTYPLLKTCCGCLRPRGRFDFDAKEWSKFGPRCRACVTKSQKDTN